MADADNIEDLEQQLNDATRMLQETETEVVPEIPVVEPETVIEPVVTEEPPVKPDEEEVPHGEKSRLGRKVKRLEDTLDQIKSSLDFLKERTVQPVQQVAPEPELPDDATPEEIRDYINKREELLLAKVEARQNERTRQSQDAIEKYARKYSQLVEKTLDQEDPEEEEIFKLMTAVGPDGRSATDYNKSYSNFQDPEEDFRINFKAATRAIINKTKPTTRTTVHNSPSKIPTGVNVPGNGKPPARVVDISKWSAEEQDLAKHFSGDELAELGIL